MTASAADNASEAADGLLDWLARQAKRRPASPAPGLVEGDFLGEVSAPILADRPRKPEGAAAPGQSSSAHPLQYDAAVRDTKITMRLPTPDWLYHRLTISGLAPDVGRFRRAAAGAGVIPWQLDLDQMEERYFHLLVAPEHRGLSVAGARIFARQLRDAVERRHEVAVSRVGPSQACPFDLHALVPVPQDILVLGPDDPKALAWLWAQWGTTDALRHVTDDSRGDGTRKESQSAGAIFRVSFWSADWTPWRALRDITGRWPTLRFYIQPTYDPT